MKPHWRRVVLCYLLLWSIIILFSSYLLQFICTIRGTYDVIMSYMNASIDLQKWCVDAGARENWRVENDLVSEFSFSSWSWWMMFSICSSSCSFIDLEDPWRLSFDLRSPTFISNNIIQSSWYYCTLCLQQSDKRTVII